MIKRSKSWEKINKFLKELDGRVDRIKRQTVMSVAESTLEMVKAKAPMNDPELGNYTDNLSVKMVKGQGVKYGIFHSGKPEKVSDLDPKKVLLYVKDIDIRKENRTNQVFRILREYEPFVVSMWPPGIPKENNFVIYKKVTEKETQTERIRNKFQINRLIQDLAKIGIRVSKNDFPDATVEAVHDITRTVYQKEAGIFQSPKPHWRPAIRSAKRNDVLNAIKKDPRMAKSLSDPDYQGWKSLGKIGESVSESAIKEVKKFQKLLMG